MTDHASDQTARPKMIWTPVKILVFGLLLLFYAVILLHKIDAPHGDDLPRLVKNGETLFHNTDILTKNVYSFTEPDQPFANHHWLSSVIFYAVHEVVGFSGLVVFKTLVLLVTFSLLFFLALKRSDFWLVAVFSVPSLFILATRVQVRPEMFSYLLICVFLWILFDAQDNPRKNLLFWLVPLQAAWVNLHIFFGIGVFMVWGFLLEKIVQRPQAWKHDPLIKKLAVVSVLLPLACLINPFGIQGIIFTLALNVSKTFPIGIVENQSLAPYFNPALLFGNHFMVMFSALIIIFALSFGLSWRQRPIFYACGFLATVAMSIWMVRALPFFVFMFLPGVTMNFQELYRKLRLYIEKQSLSWQRVTRGLAIGTLVMFLSLMTVLRLTKVIYAGTQMGIGLTYRSTETADFLINNHIRGPVFNDPDIGSYLIYYLYPEEQVFIDNRFGDTYSAEFVANDFLPMLLNETVWSQKSLEYQIGTIILSTESQLSGLRQFIIKRIHDPEWVLVHADQHAVVFIRNLSDNRDLIDAYGITSENLEARLSYLTQSDKLEDVLAAIDVMNLFDSHELATATSLSVIDRWPKTSYIWLTLGIRALNDPEVSDVLPMLYLERAISLGQRSTFAYAKLAEAYQRVGFEGRAIWAAEQALKLSLQKRDLLNIVNQLELMPASGQNLELELQSQE
jgi:hypothetical protein